MDFDLLAGEGVSCRGVIEVVAAGAAARIATPSPAQQQTAVLAEATAADYARDPTRWGSAEIAALFPGFRHLDIRTKGAVIRVRHGGSGPPLLLLHGNPVNHVTWYGAGAPPSRSGSQASRPRQLPPNAPAGHAD
jgi:hypothetical protein